MSKTGQSITGGSKTGTEVVARESASMTVSGSPAVYEFNPAVRAVENATLTATGSSSATERVYGPSIVSEYGSVTGQTEFSLDVSPLTLETASMTATSTLVANDEGKARELFLRAESESEFSVNENAILVEAGTASGSFVGEVNEIGVADETPSSTIQAVFTVAGIGTLADSASATASSVLDIFDESVAQEDGNISVVSDVEPSDTRSIATEKPTVTPDIEMRASASSFLGASASMNISFSLEVNDVALTFEDVEAAGSFVSATLDEGLAAEVAIQRADSVQDVGDEAVATDIAEVPIVVEVSQTDSVLVSEQISLDLDVTVFTVEQEQYILESSSLTADVSSATTESTSADEKPEQTIVSSFSANAEGSGQAVTSPVSVDAVGDVADQAVASEFSTVSQSFLTSIDESAAALETPSIDTDVILSIVDSATVGETTEVVKLAVSSDLTADEIASASERGEILIDSILEFAEGRTIGERILVLSGLFADRNTFTTSFDTTVELEGDGENKTELTGVYE
ncbi:hypothetical protein HCTV-16_gp43 [Haloarcula virus HCTV-16]|nr:hypothetical protein HCTV-16_gp43 [Haloarcula virus HCTV-16]